MENLGIYSVCVWAVFGFMSAGVLCHQNHGGQQAFGNQQQQQQQQQQQHMHGRGGNPQFQGNQMNRGPPGQGSGVFDKSQVQDREHIKEHLEGVAQADTSKMTDQELQFHYFKMHDSDNNNKLDGCELIKSLIHWHVTEDNNPNSPNRSPNGPKLFEDRELEVLIDPILNADDTNRDGFVDYAEFAAAQMRMAAAAGSNQQAAVH